MANIQLHQQFLHSSVRMTKFSDKPRVTILNIRGPNKLRREPLSRPRFAGRRNDRWQMMKQLRHLENKIRN